MTVAASAIAEYSLRQALRSTQPARPWRRDLEQSGEPQAGA